MKVPDKRQKYDWATKASELRERPGDWAIVVKKGEAPNARAAQNVTRYIKQGSRNMPKGQFEAETRGDVVYARFVGNPNA